MTTSLLQNYFFCKYLNMKLNDVFKRLVLAKANDLTPPKQVGRKRSLTNNEALDLIFKVLRTGMQWREIDSPYCFTTVYRRMVLWEEQGVFTAAYKHALQTYQKLNPPKYYCVDSSYVKNMFGRQDTGRNHTDRGRQALKLSIVVDHNGIVHGACHHPGNKPDVTLLTDSLSCMMERINHLSLYADKGYDSKRNRNICKEFNLKDRIFRRKTKTVRRTNARRVVVEHSFAWLDKFRRLLHLYEMSGKRYLSFVFLALGHLLCQRFVDQVSKGSNT